MKTREKNLVHFQVGRFLFTKKYIDVCDFKLKKLFNPYNFVSKKKKCKGKVLW
jgi:hypothetical protein